MTQVVLTTEATAAVQSHDASTQSRKPKAGILIHLQILRAVGASLVVLDHSLRALDSFHINHATELDPGDQLAKLAVCAFFVLSGFILMRQSGKLFALPGSAVTFFRRRILRIAPIYWIASIGWFATLAAGKSLPHFPLTQLLLSLSFIPNYVATLYGGPYPLLT